eukprot:TRINITY_DN42616_c0_g1_i1.p1 TRINITY_DN42616_c0_g1~~TRINITY_DN42616_c0_g1_i1.p1  ORF type:complete len:838 (+),score=130.20 TRINITY_DN42616_c0_g1_i1:24-2516(+)
MAFSVPLFEYRIILCLIFTCVVHCFAAADEVVPQVNATCMLQRQTNGPALPGVENGAAGDKSFGLLGMPAHIAQQVQLLYIANVSAPSSSVEGSNLHESLATQGKEFKMKKIRTWDGPQPDWERLLLDQKLQLGSKSTCQSRQWAVVTTIFPASEAVKALGQLPGWCTVVVGDRKGPQAGEYQAGSASVVHVSAAEQEEMGVKLHSMKHLPWNSFGRKNVGFLFAMNQGADTIFDFDDDNVPRVSSIQNFTHMMKQSHIVARVVDGPLQANVYPLFASTDLPWPRGFPLDAIKAAPSALVEEHTSTATVDTPTIGVVQSLAQHNPDVDAIYRLTQKLPVTFEERSPVVLDVGTFSPFNAQATFWYPVSYLTMLLPTSVHGRVADILRSYITQSALWEFGAKLAFVSPLVDVTTRNPHSLLADFQAEYPLYYKVPALLQALSKKRRELAGKTPQETLFTVYVYLYEHGFIESQDVLLAKAWIEDVARLGGLGVSPLAIRRVPSSLQVGASGSELSRISESRQQKTGVVLHMHFNFPDHASNVRWYLQETPLCHPANFLACVFVSDWSKEDLAALSDITASAHGVPARIQTCKENGMPPARWSKYHGYYMHQCFAKTLQLVSDNSEWNAHGVLFMADDAAMVKPWSLVRTGLQALNTMVLPAERNWNCCGANMRNVGSAEAVCGWPWMKHPEDKGNLIKALDSLPAEYKMRVGVNDQEAPFMKASGDVVYVPMRQAAEFQQLVTYFVKYHLHEEVALPLIATALGSRHLDGGFQLKSLWGRGRSLALSTVQSLLFKPPSENKFAFLHPLKLHESSVQDLSAVEEIYAKVFGY